MNRQLIQIVVCLICLYGAANSLATNFDRDIAEAIATLTRSPRMRLYERMSSAGRLRAVISALRGNETLWRMADKERRNVQRLEEKQKQHSLPNTFPCQPFRLSQTATSVNRLTPGDIRIVGAVGDSLTAGTGADAKTVLGLLTEYRGLVYSMGGDGSAASNPTLPNILLLYSPGLMGYSTGRGGVDSPGAGLNLANPGDNSLAMEDQVRRLIGRMRSMPGVDFERDWKLITIFIGNNDICDFCESKYKGRLTVDGYKQRLQNSLDILHAEVPRVFVNLITLLDVSQVYRLNSGLICSVLHYFECSCAAYPAKGDEGPVIEMNDKFQAVLKDLVASGRYDTRDDFTVVVQPFFQDSKLPTTPDGKIDLSYFAPDCFHFNTKGHAKTALALWNAMFQSVGKKHTTWHVGEDYHCPTLDSPYFATRKNSLSH